MKSNLGASFTLRCFQRLSLPSYSYPAMPLGRTTGTPEALVRLSSRTRDDPQISTLTAGHGPNCLTHIVTS